MIPPIWVISCTEMVQRHAAARECFAKLPWPVSWWRGVHGLTWGLETVLRYTDDGDPDYCVSTGHVGLDLSHWHLWQHLLHSPGDEWLVLEDDAVLCPEFEPRYEAAYSQLPSGWQLAYVGWIPSGRGEYELSERVGLVEGPFGTHALLLRRSALDVLLDTCALAWAHIDIQVGARALPHLRHYAFRPSLVSQRTYLGEWPGTTRESRV